MVDWLQIRSWDHPAPSLRNISARTARYLISERPLIAFIVEQKCTASLTHHVVSCQSRSESCMLSTNGCPPADELQRLLPHGITICGAWIKQEAKQEAITSLQQMAAASEKAVSIPAHFVAGNWGSSLLSSCCLLQAYSFVLEFSPLKAVFLSSSCLISKVAGKG